ncbi:hypothetical protein SO802_029555 [Lithocarpus litseifolius]|uniref:Reverse transcriptase zinc-binding domain-containing protein n=1 Tax=Lithocarpus litseifolius TaxID=425828 RepID=A0AAW2BTY0_9ROSI
MSLLYALFDKYHSDVQKIARNGLHILLGGICALTVVVFFRFLHLITDRVAYVLFDMQIVALQYGGNGMTINFWKNRWLRGCAPRELIEGPINKMECKLTVAVVLQGSEWNWAALSFNLPTNIMDRIKAIPIQLFGRKEDTLSWRQSKDREFSIALAYMLAIIDESQDTPFIGEWIWILDTLPRIQSFLWLCHHSCVPVRETLANKGLNVISHAISAEMPTNQSCTSLESALMQCNFGERLES